MRREGQIAYYQQCLASCPTDHRMLAAARLGELGPEAIEALETALKDQDKEVRLAAVRSLSTLHTSGAIEPLCRALNDSDETIREAAAEALQQWEDNRVVQPLIRALRECFVGRSARSERMIGILIFGGIALIVLGFVTRLFAISMIGAFNSIFQGVAAYFRARSARRQRAGVIVGALSRIAERSPTPELRAALPELRALAGETKNQNGAALSSGEALRRIEALSQHLWDLPVAAGIASTPPETLPRPADTSAPDSEQLPVVSARVPDEQTAAH